MNRTIPTLITAGALALTLTACGGTVESEPAVYSPTDEERIAAGEQACIAAAADRVNASDNAGIKWEGSDLNFTLSRAEGHEGRGSMSWDVTMITKIGIPWNNYYAQCIADTNVIPAEVTTLTIIEK